MIIGTVNRNNVNVKTVTQTVTDRGVIGVVARDVECKRN